nr:hypothetical protein [Tanacetum cinerariifolium]
MLDFYLYATSANFTIMGRALGNNDEDESSNDDEDDNDVKKDDEDKEEEEEHLAPADPFDVSTDDLVPSS